MDENMGEQIGQQPAARQRVTASAFASKYKSKREIYYFLTVDC